MTILKEEQISFAGKSSYQEPEKESDKLFLRQLISDLRNIVETEVNKIHHLNSKLTIELDINNNDPHMRLHMNYPNYDLFLDESIKDTGLIVQERLVTLLEKAFKTSPDFYYELHPNWKGSYLSIYMFVRPVRGTFKCPVCGNKVENSEDNFISDMVSGDENIVGCFANDHITFFVKDIINQTLKTKEYCKISEFLDLHLINSNEKEHLRLASQLNLIARNENDSFRSFRFDVNNPKMYVISEKGTPAGYVYWNDFKEHRNEGRCLRQLFIRDKFRRKGLGSLLVEKTVEIESKIKKFVVESPNDKTLGILLKLGYVKEEEDGFVGIRCTFSQGM